uniref:Uncharacterized protein n=1 Tax=Arion vulgaris TaxID=1028688 RepID=A0A0B7AZH9_9EUPU
MACNLPTGWKTIIHSQVSNRMDQQNMDLITSALFGDSNIMLNAVASLLTRHQSNKEHDTRPVSPQLDFTNTQGKDSVLANAILGTTQNKSSVPQVDKSHSQKKLIPSFEQVHALATANLLASTARYC